jgi:hypothetical protein
MAAYFVLLTGKMTTAIRIMNRAKRVKCTGEKRDAYKIYGHDHFENIKIEFVKNNIDF